MVTKSKLTNKQKAFVQEYLVDLNASAAARRAGYSARTANRIANENMGKPHVQAAIQEAMKEREKRTEITADMVIKQLAKIAFHDLKDVIEWDENSRVKIKPSDEVDGTILQEMSESLNDFGVSRKIKTNDRMKALELLGKHLGLFTDNVNLLGEVGVKIVDDVPEESEDDSE